MTKLSTRYERWVKAMHKVLKTFPVSYGGKPYVRTKDGRKVYFNIFLEKYGLAGNPGKYSKLDVLRRIRLIEFFPYFVQKFDVKATDDTRKLVIESAFFRMVLLRVGKPGKRRFELLSFYHYR